VDGNQRVDAVFGAQFVAPPAFGRAPAQTYGFNLTDFHGYFFNGTACFLMYSSSADGLGPM
jgi:hypothetical protein